MGCCFASQEKTKYVQMPEGAECAICLDPLKDSVEFAPCTHAFHTTCIRDWKKRNPVCPMCEHPLV